jgi:quercetin dioxygenase-like cupin family protein
MSYGKSIRIIAATLVALLALATGQSTPITAQEKPFRSDVITQVNIGNMKSGKYTMKATITTIQPRAKIPFHIHKYNGLRYILDGSLSISWKDGRFQTYSAGSTYFEGPGANHPDTDMAASNPTDSVTKVLIVELVPLD